MILEAKAEVNAKHQGGWAALHFATRYGQFETVKKILEARVDVNAKEKDGWTPLHHATMYRSANIVSELLKFGANVNDKTNKGYDVYDLAKYNKNERENVLP